MNKNYEVYYFSPDNPQHLEQWLEGILQTTGLRLIANSDKYWIFEQTNLFEAPAKIGSLAQDAADSYGEFYDKCMVALGFSSACLPSSEMDDMMLRKISDLFWAANNLSEALKVTYEKLPTHWRTPLPFSYSEIMNKVKHILKTHALGY